jgi:uncharacterized protein with FMN-binding domain
MRRIVIWLASTVAAVVLLLAYRTSTMGANGAPAAGGGGGPGGDAPGVVPAPSADASAGAHPADVVVNGKVARTRWGPVQVQVHIRNGKIVDVTALRQPNGNDRDQEINSYAIPQLHDEVLSAQGAQIDTVSGATVTSDGYRESLQSALDAAHVK